MSDLISRQDAIELFRKYQPYMAVRTIEFGNALKDLPSIQPERKKGRWIPQDFNKSNGMITTTAYYYPKCSVCGHTANYTNFCPNCGAEMSND